MIVTIDKFDRDNFESFQRVHFEIEELSMQSWKDLKNVFVTLFVIII